MDADVQKTTMDVVLGFGLSFYSASATMVIQAYLAETAVEITAAALSSFFSYSAVTASVLPASKTKSSKMKAYTNDKRPAKTGLSFFILNT